ncbi:adenylyltransferase/cytidyltransferase family protein [Candidatus Woesearchaeota archaeon]|nr:adenylyltransferase/cytidyltransferase family protein [Candidatus Woesearchaeota archaeon]
MGKIVFKSELRSIVSQIRKSGKKIVTTNGAFDLFHKGHVKSLKFAKEKGDLLVVCLNSDESIKKYKSEKRPIIPQQERAEIVASNIYTDYVTIFDEKTPIKILELIRPDIHVKGSEYSKRLAEKEVVEKHGGQVVFMERDPNDTSTTKIINKIIKLYGDSHEDKCN